HFIAATMQLRPRPQYLKRHVCSYGNSVSLRKSCIPEATFVYSTSPVSIGCIGMRHTSVENCANGITAKDILCGGDMIRTWRGQQKGIERVLPRWQTAIQSLCQ